MIDWQITKNETGYSEMYFNKNLKSHKKIYKICDRCGKGYWVEFRDSYKLCKSCSLKDRKLTDKHKQNIGKSVSKNLVKGKHLQTIHIDDVIINTQLFYNLNTNHIGISNTFSYREGYNNRKLITYYNKKYYKDITKIYEKEKTKKYYEQYNKTHKEPNIINRKSEESKILRFCIRQGLKRDEFTGFYNKARTHIVPTNHCIKLNSRFKGSEGHHIMRGVVIFIPKELHQLIRHNMKTGKNMKEINKLALHYLINNK